MPTLVALPDNEHDRDADLQISVCVDLAKPKSFFLFAGAGSGKTKSLVDCLANIRRESTGLLRLRGQRVGVITYTNAASDEIQERLDYDPFIEVSTIHSFVWSLIKGFNSDIRSWLRDNLLSEIEELKALQAKGRSGSKAAMDRAHSIIVKQERLAHLDQVRIFTYNPNGENYGKESLNHSEVIKIGASFLTNKPSMQRILVNRFPILLIDESQDTNKLLMDAFLFVQRAWTQQFCLGLFGDMMQRIYADGKPDLGHNLPADWATPAKTMNHRCPKRIIRLINKIRAVVDGQEQRPRSDQEEGFIRLFVLSSTADNKSGLERRVAEQMKTVTSDPEWLNNIKTLILEHHMAARRMDFSSMFEPLYREGTLNIGLLDGTLAGIRFFSEQALPLVKAKQAKDDFKVAAIVRNLSPILSKAVLKAAGDKQSMQITKAKNAVEALFVLWADGKQPRFIDVLRNVHQTGLFEIPDSLSAIASRSEEEQQQAEKFDAANGEEADSRIEAWDKMLVTPFEQIERYKKYIEGLAEFDTHQGVKGLEFPRVMVVIDDEEARGFLFSYDKLFNVKAKSKTDLEHEQAGEETGIDRTRRLFYVTCSRAERSLAIVCYSANPQAMRDYVVTEGWFEADEVLLSV